jgi:hypothetical protein
MAEEQKPKEKKSFLKFPPKMILIGTILAILAVFLIFFLYLHLNQYTGGYYYIDFLGKTYFGKGCKIITGQADLPIFTCEKVFEEVSK